MLATPIRTTTTKPFTSRPRPLHCSTKSCFWTGDSPSRCTSTRIRSMASSPSRCTPPSRLTIRLSHGSWASLMRRASANSTGSVRATKKVPDDVPSEVIFNDLKTGNPLDEDEVYEGILGGTWAPYCLVSYTGDVELPNGEVVKLPNIAPTIDGFEGDLSPFSGISGLNNVDVVLTDNKDFWTRCPVLEMQSVDELAQNGRYEKLQAACDGTLRSTRTDAMKGNRATTAVRPTPTELNLIGMGWFPGYAIDWVPASASTWRLVRTRGSAPTTATTCSGILLLTSTAA